MSTPPEEPWRRLDRRMILVSFALIMLSASPLAIATWGFGVRLSPLGAAPAIAATSLGVLSGLRDTLTWIKTRYRITDECVERRTGLLVRKYRRIPRDRIRSFDVAAKLRHRAAGLRVVTIGAGQQSAAGDALKLDALSRKVSEQLREELLRGGQLASEGPEPARTDETVIATLRWSWLFYNIVNGWAFLVAAVVLWVVYWFAGTFGVDLFAVAVAQFDSASAGVMGSLLIAVPVVFGFGVAIMALLFVTEYWGFRLTRAPGPHGTILRTAKGLTKMHQVDREDRRLRGAQISEPLLWRWAGMADTDVIATGLKVLSADSGTTILPRGPIRVARRVVAAVLDRDPSPLTEPLRRHPVAAGWRRLWWAVMLSAVFGGCLWWISTLVEWMPPWWPLLALGALLVAAGGALVSYRSLGHTLVDGYLVVRAGLTSRTTAALQTQAVVGWTFRQSIFQRRLGLVTLTATTAAGTGAYLARDLDAAAAIALADRAVPGLLSPYVARPAPAAPKPTTRHADTSVGVPALVGGAPHRLWAVSDLHVGTAENRRICDELRPTTDGDWLIVAGDVGELVSDIEWALGTLRSRFRRVLWTPGNHELWTLPCDPVQLRGEARYLALVEICRSVGVDTPEDPYPVFDGAGGPVTVAPLFLLYDYTLLPPGASTKEAALTSAYRSGALCIDEVVLHPDPYPSRAAWCEQRLAATAERLSGRAEPHLPTVLVNHFPLAGQATDQLPDPTSALWCGTTRTADWPLRFHASRVVSGQLRVPRIPVFAAATRPDGPLWLPGVQPQGGEAPARLQDVLAAADQYRLSSWKNLGTATARPDSTARW